MVPPVDPVALHIQALAILHPEDAVRVGLITAHALASKLRRKDATMYQPQAAGPDFTGIPLLAPAVPAVRPQHLAQEPAVVQDHAPLDLIG